MYLASVSAYFCHYLISANYHDGKCPCCFHIAYFSVLLLHEENRRKMIDVLWLPKHIVLREFTDHSSMLNYIFRVCKALKSIENYTTHTHKHTHKFFFNFRIPKQYWKKKILYVGSRSLVRYPIHINISIMLTLFTSW